MRLKQIFFALFLIISFPSRSQTDTIYYDAYWKICDFSFADYYRVRTKLANRMHKVEDHYMQNDKLQMTGYYSRFEPDIRNGVFVFYNKSGFKTEEGSYEGDKMNGEWKYYFDSSTSLSSIKNYIKGEPDGAFVSYYKSGGKHTEGNYQKGKQTGEWKSYYDSSMRVWATFDYGDSKQVKIISYYRDGKIKRREEHDKHGDISGKCYDEQGNETAFTPFEVMPKALYNFNDFLNANIIYPIGARNRNMQGKVIVRFVVNTDGTITNLSIVQSVDPELDGEALRVVSTFPKWQPGIQDDSAIKVYFTLPIVFTLR